ncbi:MAG: hypothetical protein ACQGVC_18145 [Myxococcota bacterium]
MSARPHPLANTDTEASPSRLCWDERKLLCGIVLQAVQDYRLGPGDVRPKQGMRRTPEKWANYQSARRFLHSDTCREVLDALGIDHGAVLAALDRPWRYESIHSRWFRKVRDEWDLWSEIGLGTGDAEQGDAAEGGAA